MGGELSGIFQCLLHDALYLEHSILKLVTRSSTRAIIIARDGNSMNVAQCVSQTFDDHAVIHDPLLARLES